jgi:hypothetical protein
MSKKQIVFMHKTSGEIKICRTVLEGQLLGDEWTQIQFTKNDKGERVMRFKFDKFTVDILPNGTREVVSDGNGSTK